MHTPAVAPAPSPLLERNLAALWSTSPQTARLLMTTSPRTDVEFFETDDGVLTAAIGRGDQQRLLASRRRPLAEGAKLADTVDVQAAAGIVVQGFGAGYHVQVLAERLKGSGVIFVFEPDVALLRAVLERIDHSSWMRTARIVILSDAQDAGAISAATRGMEGLLAMGVQIVEHPASRARLGQQGQAFAECFTSVLRAVRTSVVTTLVQSEVTIRNLLMNLDRYATCPGIADLQGIGAGRPAIVVSAGPSLRRNIDLLRRPGVRERFVIIAVQTVLKQLLAKGIRPHFVTALDYHEISRRFYEGLTATDVEDVTLVAEAKANPAILESFPGEVRIISDGFLESMLGEGLSRPLGSVKPGATVAHLAYYLARHMGCDPVILIGQDLGFTDGQYYSAGAAIHDVWAGELSQFNTLEMMEWQRIARARTHLHRTRDVLGRPVYTDEQMSTYRVQFERDFAGDVQQGLRVIDSTEGGVEKQHTRAMRLEEALAMLMPERPLRLPVARGVEDESARLLEVGSHVRQVRQDVWKIMQQSRRTERMLEEMLAHHSDQRRVNQLIGDIDRIREEVEGLLPAFTLVNFLNQTGTLNRVRRDRRIELDESLTPMERQRRQIERDIENVRWLGDAAERLGELLDDSIRVLGGSPRSTGDLIAPPDAEEMVDGSATAVRTTGAGARRRVAAVITVDFDHGGLGTARNLERVFMLDLNPLRMTLLRLAQSRELDAIVLVTDDVERARRVSGVAGGSIGGASVAFVQADVSALRQHKRLLLGSRLWTRSSWRGGLGSLTCYDEVCPATIVSRIAEERGFDAVAVVGPDWALVDPGLVDAAIARYRQRPTGKGAHRMTFCQAPPGLGACIIERELLSELAERSESAGVYATIGGMLGYMPLAPSSDPIASPVCITTPPMVRDAQFRFIPDSEPRRASLITALAVLDSDLMIAGAERIASCLAPSQFAPPEGPPQELIMELCTGRRTSGARARWMLGTGDPIERPSMPLALADRILTEFGRLRTDGAVTLSGVGDPLLHPDVLRIVKLARRAGVAGVHIRTDLVCDRDHLDALLDSGVDVISVDVMAETPETYRAIMGADLFARVRGNLEHLLTRRASRSGTAATTPWIVPRLTRCDAVYEQIESFYDRWILATGAAVIDPLPRRQPGERIEPLPLPRSAARRLARERMTILSDGRVPAEENDLSGDRCIGEISREGIMPAWRALCSKRFDAPPEPGIFSVDAYVHGSPARERTVRLEKDA